MAIEIPSVSNANPALPHLAAMGAEPPAGWFAGMMARLDALLVPAGKTDGDGDEDDRTRDDWVTASMFWPHF